MSPIAFIDTSVLCNLIPVPGMDQSSAEIKTELKVRLAEGWQFILPITSVIETGNHIAHLSDGRLRRATADTFVKIMQLVQQGKAPWLLHDVPWDADFLKLLLAGADTGSGYVDNATRGVGAGDLCILTERLTYQARSGIRAEIWSIDSDLTAHSA
ncbi:hypothetical protein [Gephyromycinifex aptenodytis]|uniref:hypothetical protein n=1 Tax=Gephyromycinifex aptenodytis TaxID=2716227 RepID=UPI001B2FF704|nr:hypothetical protein [Gephyromycinifex aptenodytis]